jgi:MFS family permease
LLSSDAAIRRSEFRAAAASASDSGGVSATLAACLIPAGKLGDRFGRKNMYTFGVVLFGVTSVAIGLSGGIEDVLLV